jgi:hypothetical protein
VADSRDMYLVHRLFRREFPAAAALVGTVAAGDRAAAARVGGHVLMVTEMLELHHGGEDELVWPKLLARGPDEIEPLVATMERQHGDLHRALVDVRARVTAWLAGATAADRDAVAAAVAATVPPLREHLDTEEAQVLRLIDEHLTEAEWAEVGRHGIAALPTRQLPVAFGMALRDGPPDQVAALRAVVPAPAWFVLSRVGPPAYARYARRLGLDRVA